METTNDPEVFWREYEQQYGEKVLAHALGRYVSGWEAFPMPLWGLLIATEGGFRFHHFPHEGWISALARVSGAGGPPPEEKTLFIPKGDILGAELRIARSWWRRLLAMHPPVFALRYKREDGDVSLLLAESDQSAEDVAKALSMTHS